MITGLKRALCCHQELPVPYVCWWDVFHANPAVRYRAVLVVLSLG